jgi:2-oxo-4-hydroxy-4-carboxy--5-ureidoimidazoline (OHCU) decarboxylase
MGLRVAMSLEQAILEAVRTLPAEKQQEILSHATRLREEAAGKKPFKSVKGLWEGLGISLSAADIEQNQREMLKNFPREDI